jgi:hypothetical protein
MVSSKVIVIGTVMLSGCALLPPTEHPTPNATISRWGVNCANPAVERSLFERNLKLIDKTQLEQNTVAREKVAIINDKILESDDKCGSRSR